MKDNARFWTRSRFFWTYSAVYYLNWFSFNHYRIKMMLLMFKINYQFLALVSIKLKSILERSIHDTKGRLKEFLRGKLEELVDSLQEQSE